MKHSRSDPQAENVSTPPAPAPHKDKKRKSLSMHDGIAVWCDCCSCEMEPYWAEVAKEMGIDVTDDYEV